MSEYVIETHELWVQFGNKIAINDLNLRIIKGGVHSIVGSNGAGKTTLFKLLLGTLLPSYGHCKILGQDCGSLSPATRGKIGFVNEDHSLPSWMKVKSLKRMQQSFYQDWDESIYQEVIGSFNVGAGQKVSQLSRGERAGLNLAMSLAQRPEVLILDEPTLGLDVVSKQAFLESLLYSSNAEGRTTIYCSHQMDEVEKVADHLIVMEQGKLINVSAPDEFCERIDYWVAQFDVTPQIERLPGLLQSRVIEGEHHVMVLDQDATLQSEFEKLGANSAFRSRVNLSQAVNGFLSRNHVRPSESKG
ncbi:MAG: ATP-binding cassette domain-containing protein [Pirellulaceae bacterium]